MWHSMQVRRSHGYDTRKEDAMFCSGWWDQDDIRKATAKTNAHKKKWRLFIFEILYNRKQDPITERAIAEIICDYSCESRYLRHRQNVLDNINSICMVWFRGFSALEIMNSVGAAVYFGRTRPYTSGYAPVILLRCHGVGYCIARVLQRADLEPRKKVKEFIKAIKAHKHYWENSVIVSLVPASAFLGFRIVWDCCPDSVIRVDSRSHAKVFAF